MPNNFTKSLFLPLLLIFFFGRTATGQTLSTPNFTGGTFTPGSTIGVPFHINSAGGCIQPTNQYNLYLSDASGNFAPGTVIGTISGAYATFVNGIIPAGTVPGGSYKVMISATAPAVSSAPSAPFSIVAGTAVTAAINGQVINTDPHTFGSCNGQPSTDYDFTDNSSTGSSVASFFNESSQSSSGTVTLNQGGSFTAATANYTILVTATNAGTIGTQAYSLINNVINNSFGVSNTTAVCLAPAGGTLSYFVDTSSPNGIQNNYPGVTYHISWGDGSSNDFSYCDIIALNDVVSHTYLTGSCGNTANGIPNSFEVDITPIVPYCNSPVPPLTSYARILKVPTNSFTFPSTGCTNTPITFTNTSDPGQDPTATVNNCSNPNARYTWSVDGSPVLINVPITAQLTHTFTTNVVHTVTLHLIVNGTTTICSTGDVTQTICIQNPPQPAFTIPATLCSSTPLIPTDQSVIDPGCNSPATYLWTVTGPAPVGYTGSTNASSVQPHFLFSQSGTYSITLTISNSSCSATTAPQTINVDAPPVVSMSPDFAICSTNLTYNFGPATGQTQTIISGTAQAQANTYAWAITGNSNYSFTGGTTSASQYPQILFTAFATYNVSVTVQNSCGTVTKSQNITFQDAPTVTLTPSTLNICPGSPVTLTGTITPSAGTTFQWIGSGIFSAPGALVTDYTPTAAEIAAHSATVKLVVQTGLAGPCNQITQTATINIYPVNSITSPASKTICTGNAVNYNMTAVVPGSTYTWTAAVTSGTATGVAASGSGSAITDVITNTDPVNNAIVTYTVTPTANSCQGTPFTFKVTVKPDPVITATPVNNIICSGSTGTINLSSNIAGTLYTWTSTVQAGSVTGNHQQAATTSNNIIGDVLNNTGNTVATVVYTITPFNGTCQGIPVTATINVQPLPTPANPGSDIELCNATTYTLNGNTPSAGIGKWTVSPATTATFSDDTQPNALVSGLVPGTTYVFTWTITVAGCQSSNNNMTLKDDVAPIGGITTGGMAVCSGSNGGTINLTGQVGNIINWEQSINNGATWQMIANNSTSQTYLNLGTTTMFRAVVQSGICTPAYSTIATITVNPPAVLADAGPNNEICNAVTYPLQGNPPGSAAGQWTVTSGPPGATFADNTQSNTIVSGLIPGNTYGFTWTITPLAPCTPTSSTVTIKDDAPPVGGTTAGSTAVCSGSGSGTITLSGQFGNIIRWEQSIDNGATWQPVNNATTSLQYMNLITTTQYRAVVQNGVCAAVNSTVATITVNPPAILADAGPNNEVCNATTYPLQGNSPGTATGKWTVTSGPAGATFADDTQFGTTVSGLVPGNTYSFTWTLTPLAPCVSTSSTVTIKDDAPPIGGIAAGSTAVCLGGGTGTITLTGQFGNIVRWEQSVDNGATWQPVNNATTSLQYMNLTTTTQYRAVVQNGVCAAVNSTVAIITVNPPAILADAGPNNEICNAAAYPLQGNAPGSAAGKWTITSGQTGVTFVDATNPTTTVNGLIPGNTYNFTWTITPLAPCTPTSSSVTIIDDPATVGGTTATNAIVCAGSNSGTITLSGQVGGVIRWEQSTDNGISWQTIANTTTSQQYLNLVITTQYRAVVQSNICQIQYSTVTIITVNPVTIPADAGNTQNLCGATSTTLQANNPSPFSGSWTQTSGPNAVIVTPGNFKTVVNGLITGSNYTFLWTINGQAPCVNTSSSVQVFTAPDAIPAFTADKTNGCGAYSVNFTNTSNITTGTTFLWDFGDGSAPSNSISPSHVFLPRTDGKDTTYQVSLAILNNCFLRPPFTVNITVKPSVPLATILPNPNGCSPFVLTVKNTSPGNNVSYVFYLYNGSTLIQTINKTDKSDAVFNVITTNVTTTYTVYMDATGTCNNTAESNHVPVVVSPSSVDAQMFINNNLNKGCVPFTATFVNNSYGGQNFYYTIFDQNKNVLNQFTASRADFTYTFTTVGTYYISLTGSDNCSTNESPQTRVDVYPIPQPQFDADVKSGCNKILVHFTNLTADAPTAPASSLAYLWVFGDGTQATGFTPPTHIFAHRAAPYTVTLTAINPATGCSNIIAKQNFITVTNPPGTQFAVKPDTVISIPYHHFSFVDVTTGSPISWYWTFGDGATSTRRNNEYTYADTGLYKVTLTTANSQGCDSTVSHMVRITGVPGQLFLPNAFEPAGLSTQLRTFMAKGSGIKKWHMQIFNNYAQLVWETSTLSEKGEPVDGWDGTFKGIPAPQGVYVWQVSATFINGTDWKGNVVKDSSPKRVGVVHLIR